MIPMGVTKGAKTIRVIVGKQLSGGVRGRHQPAKSSQTSRLAQTTHLNSNVGPSVHSEAHNL
jgi:hypothetical protein